jgi:DNA modification methylase
LIRLVTPPDGVILDPFAGSGTTLEAAMQEGVLAIGIEFDPAHLPLIMHRIERTP